MVSRETKKRKLFVFLLIYLFLVGGFIWLLTKVHWLAVIVFIFLAIFFTFGLIIASKGKKYEEKVDSMLDSLVNILVKINIGTYDTIVYVVKNFITWLRNFYLDFVVPAFIYATLLVVAWGLLILIRYLNTLWPNSATYLILFLAFVSPLWVNQLQYNLKKPKKAIASDFDDFPGEWQLPSFAQKLQEKARKVFLSAVEVALGFLFLFMDSTSAFFIPQNLRQVPLVSKLWGYDLTLRLYSSKQLDFAFMVVMASILVNFLKVFLEKTIYHFYLRHGYVAKDVNVRQFKYTNLILTTLALHIIFLPFIRLKHLVLTVGFIANFVADIFAAFNDKEVWIVRETEPVDIIGQLNKYVVVPALKTIFRIISVFTPF